MTILQRIILIAYEVVNKYIYKLKTAKPTYCYENSLIHEGLNVFKNWYIFISFNGYVPESRVYYVSQG